MSNILTYLSSLKQRAPISSFLILSWIVIATLAPPFVHEPNQGFFPALIPYNPSSIDLLNANAISPLEEQSVKSLYFHHWLGTDEIGRDLLSQLIHGSRTALLVGFLSVLISAFIGIFLGSFPAFVGDRTIQVNTTKFLLVSTISLLVILYTIFVMPWDYLTLFSSLLLTAVIFGMLYFFWNWTFSSKTNKGKSIYLPFDLVSGRMIETMDSLPLLFIIISLSAIVKPSIYGIVFIIGISNWATIARYARAETLKVKELPFIEAARAMGLPKRKILMNHILPNSLRPVLITLAFGVAASILIEATLSFLGIGMGVEDASWGSIMAEARKHPEAWWLATFPGLAIFLVVYSCNKLGERMIE